MTSIYILKKIAAFFFFVLLFSCNSNDEKTATKPKVDEQIADTLKISDQPVCSPQEKDRNFIGMLHLDTLDSGFDGQQVRFWFNYLNSDSLKVITLTYQQQQWHARIYYCLYRSKDGVYIESIERKVEEAVPRNGWPGFLEKMDSLGFDKLKDCDIGEAGKNCIDGDNLSIEIASHKIYKVLRYGCYTNYENTVPEIIALKKILVEIQEEFGFKLFPRLSFS